MEVGIMGERKGFEQEWAELKHEWAQLTPRQKRAARERFTQDIDEGVAGWNRHHPILWPAYELGDQVLAEALE